MVIRLGLLGIASQLPRGMIIAHLWFGDYHLSLERWSKPLWGKFYRWPNMMLSLWRLRLQIQRARSDS